MKKTKTYNFIMCWVMGMVISFSTVVLGFAASPSLAKDNAEPKYASVWDAIDEQAEDVDLEILAEYMNQDILNNIPASDNIREYLYNYCSYDETFIAVLEDYFC